MMADDYVSDDDFIVTEVAVSDHSGYLRVKTYGPYTRNHAVRVRDWYRKHPPGGNWTYTYLMTQMRRDQAEEAA